MQPKALIPEQRLIDTINLALSKDWPHKDRSCRVLALKRVNLPERNWEVVSTTLGGSDLSHAAECQNTLDRVLNELVGKYDVHWPS